MKKEAISDSCGFMQVYVEGYRKKDGTLVHGYCRDLPARQLSDSYEGPMTKKERDEFQYRNFMRGYE